MMEIIQICDALVEQKLRCLCTLFVLYSYFFNNFSKNKIYLNKNKTIAGGKKNLQQNNN